MARFLTTRGITYELETLIRQADDRLVLITPYLKLGENVQERLISASDRGVRIQLVFGKSALSRKDERALGRIHNLEVRYYRDLHAKCYHNCQSVIVSSMNLHEYSEVNNREVGVLLEPGNDDQAIRDAIRETEDIGRHADLLFDATIEPKLRSFSIRSGGAPLPPVYSSRLGPLVEALEPNATVGFFQDEIYVNRLFEWSLSCTIRLSVSRYAFEFKYKRKYQTQRAVVPFLQKHLPGIASRIGASILNPETRGSAHQFVLSVDRPIPDDSRLEWTKSEIDQVADDLLRVLSSIRDLVADASRSIAAPGVT
jgi:hypothetical protein